MAIYTYKKGDSAKLSPNFRAREFDCNGTGCCAETKIDESLVAYLQQIRDHFGKPVYVTGYRCKTHNARVPNAAPNSYHIYGMAADISIRGTDPLEIAKYAESIGILGIGLYADFVHVDTRAKKSFWYGHEGVRRDTFAQEDYPLAQFVRDVQAATGSAVDGIPGPETLKNTVTVSASINRTHPAVKAVQRRLYALGYTQVGGADGVAGQKFDLALKAFQKDNGCVADGELTAKNKTWQKLLGML